MKHCRVFQGGWDANTGVNEPRVPPPEEAWVAARHLVAGRTKG